MKTVAIYYKTTSDNYKAEWCKAFEQGINVHNNEWKTIPVYNGNLVESDYAFCFNFQPLNALDKPNTTLRRRVIDKYEPKIFYLDGDVLISYDHNGDKDKTKILFNTMGNKLFVRPVFGHVWPSSGGKWLMSHNPDSKRWEKIKNDRNIIVKDYDIKKGDYILINLNRGSEGYSGEQKNAAEYAIETTNILRQYTDRPIIIRMHRATGMFGVQDFNKLYAWSTSGQIKNVKIQSKQLREYPDLFEVIRNSYAVVTFASSSACPAIIEGKPVFVSSPNCYFYDMNAGQLSDIEKPNLNLDRENFFLRYANTHFNLYDFSSGYYWDIVKNMI
jgi:hypothetical protein